MRWALFAVAGCGFHRGAALGPIDDAPADIGDAVDAVADVAIDGPPPPIELVQINSANTSSNVSSIAVDFTMPEQAGDLAVVVVGWYPSGSAVATISDTAGTSYLLATGPSAAGMENQSLYYRCGIAAATTNRVTVTFTTAIQPDVHVIEYSGIRATGCLDKATSTAGNGTAMDVGPVVTTHARDLLVAATFQTYQVSAGDPMYTSRGINGFGDLVEDRVVTATGSYHALATQNTSADWVMQLGAFEGL